MTATFIKNFAEISKKDTDTAGGKGASLGEMTQAGIPVPAGFVILSNAFDKFLAETDLNVEIDAVLDGIDVKKVHTIEEASEKIEAMILSKEVPEDIKAEILKSHKKLNANFVAVRSSATSEDSASAAWAGQLDTVLNTTEKKLLENVRKCWASLFTPRAIFYRFENKLRKENISVAVVVQKMVNSDMSGIAFSVHPVTQDKKQIIIEAGFGLGEAIVSGAITPDSYVVDKKGFDILDINVNRQSKALYKKNIGGNEWKELGAKGEEQVLTKKEITKLSKLIVKIENHYGFAVDVEWASEKERFYITQSRPITTLATNQQEVKVLTRYFSRPYPITQLDSYYDALDTFKKKFGFSTYPLFKYDKDKHLVEVYFQREELRKLFQAIGAYASNKEVFQGIVRDFKKAIDEIAPFLEGKMVEKEELQKLYGLFLRFYVGIAYMWVLPGLNNIPDELKKSALAIREKTEKYSSQRDRLFVNILSKLYPKIGKKTAFISLKEVLSGLDEYELLKRARERSKGFILFNKEMVSGSKLDSFLTDNHLELKVESGYDEKESTIKGTTAQAGKVKGVVKIVYTAEDLGKIEEGDILVSPMTRPEFLPAMKKVRAFVTDEGGVTCHAAIVAREMKKPCVIGTKNATSILRDGYLIDVDANRGVIKIIEKTQE